MFLTYFFCAVHYTVYLYHVASRDFIFQQEQLLLCPFIGINFYCSNLKFALAVLRSCGLILSVLREYYFPFLAIGKKAFKRRYFLQGNILFCFSHISLMKHAAVMSGNTLLQVDSLTSRYFTAISLSLWQDKDFFPGQRNELFCIQILNYMCAIVLLPSR